MIVKLLASNYKELLFFQRKEASYYCDLGLMGLCHVVAAGTEPLKHEDGASCGLHSHHHHQHPRGEVKRLKEGSGGDDPCPLGDEDGYPSLQEWDREVNYRFSK